jgi:hypothetical protein
MGLLDQFFSDDPQKVAQMAMAFGLLGGAPNGRKNFGADLSNAGLLGMQAYGTSKSAQAKLQEKEATAEPTARAANQDGAATV